MSNRSNERGAPDRLLSGGPATFVADNGTAADPDGVKSAADRLNRALTRLVWLEQKSFAEVLARLGLTVPQYIALVQVNRHEPGLPIGDLAQCLRQSSATMTGIVDRLVRMELVQRTRHERDRRVVLVVVTDEGRRLVREAHGAKCVRTAQVLRVLPSDAATDLCHLLQRYLEVAEGLE